MTEASPISKEPFPPRVKISAFRGDQKRTYPARQQFWKTLPEIVAWSGEWSPCEETEYLSLTEHQALLVAARREATIFEPEADKIVCQWSMAEGVALTEAQLNSLVNRIAHRFDDCQTKAAQARSEEAP